jgi:hypothetical protein
MCEAELARYLAINWSNYNAALRKRRAFLIWLDKRMAWLPKFDTSRLI